MSDRLILALNAGSSSLTFDVLAADGRPAARLTAGAVRDIGRGSAVFERDAHTEPLEDMPDMRAAAELVLARLFDGESADALDGARLAASGHRVVHGGERFFEPLRITV